MRLALACVLLLSAATASAQEGFPLDGTWRGEVTNRDGSPRTIVLIMQWDGKSVTGTINPGPNSSDFTGGRLDAEGWKFTLNAPGTKLGAVRFEGTIQDLGKVNRRLVGKWTDSAGTIDIRFVRE